MGYDESVNPILHSGSPRWWERWRHGFNRQSKHMIHRNSKTMRGTKRYADGRQRMGKKG